MQLSVPPEKHDAIRARLRAPVPKPPNDLNVQLTVSRPSVVFLPEGEEAAPRQQPVLTSTTAWPHGEHVNVGGRGMAPERSLVGHPTAAGQDTDVSFNTLVASYHPPKAPALGGAPDEQRIRMMNDESMLSLQTAIAAAPLDADAATANATDASAQRQLFLTDQRRQQRACHWHVVVETARFVTATMDGLQATKAQSQARSLMNPRCLLGLRRALRRARLRMLSPSMRRPAVAAVRNDKMLGLFSEAHVQYLIDNLVPKYFFAREGIIFMGSEDDECYVLFSGSADVMMGKTRVFTMTGGMVFGSVGMISGEPRTATIIARENCLVWSIGRSVFESYGARDHQVAAAQAIIRELRQKNIRSVYKGLIDPEFLMSKFSMLKGCSTQGVAMLLAKSEPRVLKHGEQLHAPPEEDVPLAAVPSPYVQGPHTSNTALSTDTDVLFVLRGRVRILRNTAFPLPDEKCLEEHLTFLLELASKRLPGAEEDTITKYAAEYTSALPNNLKHVGTKELICEVSGPMLINLAPLMLREPSPLIVETVGGCDILVLTNGTFHRLPDADIAVLRQNALNIHCPFVKSLGRSVMLQTIFQSKLSFDFLSRLQTAHIHQEPFVFSPGSVLKFGVPNTRIFHRQGTSRKRQQNPLTAALILRGEISTSSEARGAPSHPSLWPDVTLMLFGCEQCEAVCLTRVEAILLSRADVIDALLVALNEGQLETLCSALTTAFVARVGRRPVMEGYGVHPTKGTTQGRWKHFIAVSKEAARTARPVHVVQPPTSGRKGPARGGGVETSHEASRGMVSDSTDPPSLGYPGDQLSSRTKSVTRAKSTARSFHQQDDSFSYDDERSSVSSAAHDGQIGQPLVSEPSLPMHGSSFGLQDPLSFDQLLSRYATTSDTFLGAIPSIAQAPTAPSPAHTLRPSSGYRREARSPQQARQQRQGTLLRQHRPASAATNTAPRMRLGLAARERRIAEASGVFQHKATGGNVVMRHSLRSKGVSAQDKLHQVLEEFFS